MSRTPKKPREAESSRRPAAKTAHKWLFPSRIRPNAFSWKSSRVAVDRIREAVGEISAVARHDTALAAEGAVRLIERLSPALEHVDSSSGALGSAVNGAIETLVPIIAGAKVSEKVRKQWLKRLFAAHEADAMPYIEILTDYWGELRHAGARERLGGRARWHHPLGLEPRQEPTGALSRDHGVPRCAPSRPSVCRALRHPQSREVLALQALGGEGVGRRGQSG